MKNPAFSQRHPYWLSILLGLICMVLTAAGSALTQIFSLDANLSYLFMAAACSLSALVGLLIMKNSRLSLREYGFRLPLSQSLSKVWFYLPLLLIEVVPFFFFGWDAAKSLPLLALFCISVGFNEEIYFRGLIRKLIGQKGRKKAVLWSAVLFGVMHSASLLGGADPLNTLLQVAFAFLVGIVLTQIVFITESLWIPILWHGLHDFIAFMTDSGAAQSSFLLSAIQVALLVFYAVVLWKNACQEKAS